MDADNCGCFADENCQHGPGPIVSKEELEIEAAVAQIKADPRNLWAAKIKRGMDDLTTAVQALGLNTPDDLPTSVGHLQALRKADKLAARLGARIDMVAAERRRIEDITAEIHAPSGGVLMELADALTYLRIAQNHLENARDSLR
jgi:hypothetical protein